MSANIRMKKDAKNNDFFSPRMNVLFNIIVDFSFETILVL